ncbi:MAG: thioredoxin domain-containing protein [Campylobacterota bacterium]|nr:thioredoxin domain-containing protein [Campylobacterota bacterium]
MANRLAFEDSPYLQQHKNNPVEWYPWCDEAFERAKQENKAIFISIGYSSCHWCHVMEHEVFENEEIAAYLNEHLISIKVDREERPDIDKHYQEVHQLLNNRPGGWPTSIIATPKNKAFFAATYMPPYQKDHLMGFDELIKIVATKVGENDKKLFDTAEEIQGYLKPSARPTQATKLNESVANTFVKQAANNYDPAYGGFTKQPKFPHASTLTTLLNIGLINNNDEAKKMVGHSLEMMQIGGMYDLVEGGFCRYSVDSEWLVPHFEKMTYDNGLLCELYAKAGIQLNNESFIRTAKEIADFMLAKMSENDLFYSASDADTEGEEGKYFVYSVDETAAALSDAGIAQDEIATILETLHITKAGNFEGRSIVRLASSERPDWFGRVQEVLKAIRNKHEYPFIDKKVQVSWNAMMIRALYTLSSFDERYLDAAEKRLDALLSSMIIDGNLYHSTLINRTPKVEAFLEDYAYLGTALIAAYQSTMDETYIIKAQQMANSALEKFYDNGRWYFSQGEFVTEADTTDSSYPGAVGVMVDLLISLGALCEVSYRNLAFKTIEYYSFKMGKTPIYFPYFFNQTLRFIKEERIIKASAETLLEHKAQLARTTYPYTLLHADPTSDGFMICGVNSCFATTQNADEINLLIKGSFTGL